MVNYMERRNLDRKGALNLSTIGLFAAAGVIAIITAAMSTKVAEGGWAEFLHALDKMQEFIQSLESRWLIATAITLVYVLRTFIPIPFPFLFMMTGVMFRPLEALAINTMGFCVVLVTTYWLGRSTDGGVALKKLKKYDNIQEMIRHHGKTKLGILVALRLVPGIPVNTVSTIYGGMEFPLSRYVIASWIGFFPKIWTYTVMGGNIAQPFTWKFMSPIIILLILSGVVTWVVNITLDKRKGEDDNVSSDS